MKRATIPVFAMTFLAAWLIVPAVGHAGDVCFTNAFGQFFRLNVKPTCKVRGGAQKLTSVNGVWHPGFVCNGRTAWTLDGSCVNTAAEVRINMTAPLLDPGGACTQVFWSMVGATLDTAVGAYDNAPFDGIPTGPDAWAPAACALEPALPPNAGPLAPQTLAVEGPAPGRP